MAMTRTITIYTNIRLRCVNVECIGVYVRFFLCLYFYFRLRLIAIFWRSVCIYFPRFCGYTKNRFQLSTATVIFFFIYGFIKSHNYRIKLNTIWHLKLSKLRCDFVKLFRCFHFSLMLCRCFFSFFVLLFLSLLLLSRGSECDAAHWC